jgi:RNA polymerase sigma factor (sigma-70 family)
MAKPQKLWTIDHRLPHATLFFLPCLLNQRVGFRLDQPVLNMHDELIARCKAGDRQAHYSLYKLYSKAMYNVGYRITRSEEEAEDVLQEAFINAFRNLDSYRGEATFGAWLKRIVVNNALSKRKHEPIPEDDRWDVAEAEPPVEYGDKLTVDRVKRCIELLPDGYRSVLSLYLMEGYDHQEIAEIMGISESTSKSQLNRAKSKLRELLIGKVSS